MVRLCM